MTIQLDLFNRKPTLTQERLMEVLRYDPQTGVFTRLKSGGGHPAGVRAGYVDSSGYRKIGIDYVINYEHRLAFLYMTGRFPEFQVDHINGVRNCNQWRNLRPATIQQNRFNQPHLAAHNTSGIRGVRWYGRYGKWHAQIQISGKRLHLGYHACIAHAIAARRAAELEWFGEFAPRRETAADEA